MLVFEHNLLGGGRQAEQGAIVAGVPAATRSIGGRFGRWIGFVLLVHFAFVFANVMTRRFCGEILWLSHIGLLLAGMGLVLQSVPLVATALAAVGVPHGCWLIDSLFGLIWGWFPLGGTAYLLTEDHWTRIATSHHFYLAPLLLVIVWRHRSNSKAALPMASLLFLVLTVASRVAVPPEVNVNYAFHVDAATDNPFVIWMNSLSAVPYLLVLNACVAGGMFLPVALLMHFRARSSRGCSGRGV